MAEKKELWLKSIEEFGQDLWTLDKYKDLRLYKLVKNYEDKHNYYYEVSYHLWDGDEWVCTSRDYNSVYMIFDNRVDEMRRGKNAL